MSTRFSLPTSGAAPVIVPFDAGWTVTPSSVARLQAVTVKSNTPAITTTIGGSKHVANLHTGTQMLTRQYVSGTLNAQTISGTLKGIIRSAVDQAGSVPLTPNLVVRVVSRDGQTVRGTLVAITAAPAATAFTTSMTNRKYPPAYAGAGVTLSSVVCSVGDRIVFETGVYYGSNGGFGAAQLEFGDTAADLVENETGTTSGSPWIEFSANLVFEGGGSTSSGADPGTGPAAVSGTVTVPRLSIPWDFWVCDLNGVRLAQVSQQLSDVSINVGRNKPLTVTGKFPSNDAKVLKVQSDGYILMQPGLRVLKGYRNEAGTNTLRASCFLYICEDHEDGFTGFTAYDPLFELGLRLCRDTSGNPGISFDTAPGAEVVQLLIDNANLQSPTGVQTIGSTLPTLATFTGTMDVNKSVGQAIIDLATASPGFDIYMAPIDHTDGYLARMYLYAGGQGSTKADVILAYAIAPHSAATMSRTEDASQLANTIVGIGNGFTSTTSNPTSQALYRWKEQTATFSDVADAAFLSTKATAALRTTPPTTVSGTPVAGRFPEPWTHWFIGDTITARAGTRMRGGFTGTGTIEEFTVSITANGYEQLAEIALKTA